MKTACKKLLITMFISALPTVAVAAESSPTPDKKPSSPVQPAQHAPGSNVQKSPETPAQPAVAVTPQQAAQPNSQSTTPPPIVISPQPAVQVSTPQPGVTTNVTGTPPVSTEPLKAQPAVLVGYIDLARVGNETEIGKGGQTKLLEKKKKLQAQVEAKRKQLDKLKSSIEAQMATTPPEQRETKSKEFRKKVEDFQKFGQNAENELQKMQQDLSRSLYSHVEQAAAEYAKANNLSIVIARRDLLYQSVGVIPMDVTEGVVKLINEKKPEKKQ